MTATILSKLPADAGTWREVEGGFEMRFERRLRHSPERVWKAMTTPEGLACWLAEEAFGICFQLAQDHCADFFRTVSFARHSHFYVVVGLDPHLGVVA